MSIAVNLVILSVCLKEYIVVNSYNNNFILIYLKINQNKIIIITINFNVFL